MLIYGSSTMGATVHLHYCMNEFVGWSLLHSKDESCGKCGMVEKDKSGCCKDEHKQFKLKIDQQKAGFDQFLSLLITPALPTPVIYFSFIAFLKVIEKYPVSHAPPDIVRKRLHVLHCVFLI
jgi:hypothetical protein